MKIEILTENAKGKIFVYHKKLGEQYDIESAKTKNNMIFFIYRTIWNWMQVLEINHRTIK